VTESIKTDASFARLRGTGVSPDLIECGDRLELAVEVVAIGGMRRSGDTKVHVLALSSLLWKNTLPGQTARGYCLTS